jgi:hypothetical protein
MNTCFVLASGTIELYFYGELDSLAHAKAQRHLGTCLECRHALEELQVISSALAARPDVASPPGGDWIGFMARLDESTRSQSPAHARQSGDTRPARRALRLYAGYVAMAALLALVTTSVAYVARSRAALVADPAATDIGGSAASVESDPSPPPRPWTANAAFASLSEQHFERSKLVVLGLASKDPQEVGAGEWEYERALASTLLSDTRLYRLAAEERGMTTLAKVMGDLELVLLQTSLSRDPEPSTLEQIQSLIRKRDLVTKMNVVTVAGI